MECRKSDENLTHLTRRFALPALLRNKGVIFARTSFFTTKRCDRPLPERKLLFGKSLFLVKPNPAPAAVHLATSRPMFLELKPKWPYASGKSPYSEPLRPCLRKDSQRASGANSGAAL